MTNYIVSVKIKINPQQYTDSRYDVYGKSFEEGKSAAEANQHPPIEAEINLYVKKLVLDRLPLDNEIKSVFVEEISQEEEPNKE